MSFLRPARLRGNVPPPDPEKRAALIEAKVLRPGPADLNHDITRAIEAGPCLAIDAIGRAAAERAQERGVWFGGGQRGPGPGRDVVR